MNNIKKAYAITDAKISFVSLVDKAANKKEFLIVKAEDGKASFTTSGKIVKTDKENHYVTGIVYEPMTEDAHGEFMTEAEITKAAYWFAKHGNQCDIQHNLEKLENSAVVESYVTKCDMEIDGQPIKKGTWMMTVEIDDETFEKVEKGELTGFSMGGVGKHSQVDVELPNDDGIIAKIAKVFGLKPINKGAMADAYNTRIKGDNFYTAYSTLRDTIETHIPGKGYTFISDETILREALTDFNNVVVELLAEDSVTKALEGTVIKAGKKMAGPRLKTLKEIQSKVTELITEVDDEMEDDNMNTEELNKAIAKALEPMTSKLENIAKALEVNNEPVVPAPQTGEVQKNEADLVADAIAKALEPMTTKLESVSTTVSAIAKARNLPNNLNDQGTDGNVQKSEPHYMTGIL
ncbi:MAG: XkdF-like putative serine protease domain-containing protein [Clostridia bacterium]|nr:XkdF-like putative serine protease domain-containing protein [Clostridia bacterium]